MGALYEFHALTAAIRGARMDMEALALAGELKGNRAVACEGLFPLWEPGAVSLGEVRRWEGQVWRCCQTHDSTGQPGWEPGAAPALWAPYHATDPAFAKDFFQPTGAQDAYQKGEVCRFEGRVWRSLLDGNGYSPQAHPSGWEAVGE